MKELQELDEREFNLSAATAGQNLSIHFYNMTMTNTLDLQPVRTFSLYSTHKNGEAAVAKS